MTRANQTDSVNNPCVNCRFNIAPRVPNHVDSRLAHAKTGPLDRNFYQIAPVFVRIVAVSTDRKITPNTGVLQFQLRKRFSVARDEPEDNASTF